MGPVLPQLISSIVMLLIALGVKDSVDHAIKRQELQLSYVKEMEVHLIAMAKADAGQEDVERAGVLVSVFGQPAVMPLMNELRYKGNRNLGAQAGLRSLAFMNCDAICNIVPRVVSSPARTLDWEGMMVSAEVLAAGNCVSALPILREHERRLNEARAGNSESLKAIVDAIPSPAQQAAWQESLSESIKILSSTGAPRM